MPFVATPVKIPEDIRQHRIRYWLHSSEKIDSPETFTEKVNEIFTVYHEAEKVHENGSHAISVDEMIGIGAQISG